MSNKINQFTMRHKDHYITNPLKAAEMVGENPGPILKGSNSYKINYAMTKTFFFLATLVVLGSCNNQDNSEAIKKQINRNKDKINQLTSKNALLQEKLSSDSSLNKDAFRTAVTLKKITKGPFSHFISLSGKVEADLEAFVSPQVGGQIRSIRVREASFVKKGELLVSLGTEVTEKSIEEVKTGLELASILYNKQKELWDQKIGSEVQYLQTKASKESLEARLAMLHEQLEMASIRAPFDGIVEKIYMKEGELAMPGSRILHIVNLGNLTIKADLSESYLADVRVGEPVTVEFPSYPGMSLSLPISRTGSVIDNASRTFRVEVRFSNPGGKIKPNQLATMLIKDFYSENAFVVPAVVIKQDANGHFLYHAVDDGSGGLKASKIYVKPGKSYLENTMVLEGIEEGMQIIDKGYNLVKDGSPVQVKM